MPQKYKDGGVEPAIVTSGDDVTKLGRFVNWDTVSYSSHDVINELLESDRTGSITPAITTTTLKRGHCMPPLFLYAGGTTSASSANAWHAIPALNGQSRLAVMKAGEIVNRIKSC